ncbi:Spermidine/putrescine import ATP-binding protein PotA [Luteitalea pratensis]|uniref:Spermidine/putrescine import ATP-binding protein PotA n=1 Tax=Luteitalea pratensis TaxID=1855912 RepID=A0A143PIQ0_LUTPR|nr:ABC transporter ATP-binding protein [Luteitalea pratensis]AMY08437.1 Spermidine/putrescine import ATP-binding protein PotA [Luteitalea pratensis]
MKGELQIRGVTKSYGQVRAVLDVSLDVRPGEFVTLLGPSGCGKTTLLRLVAGFEQPDAGTITISGHDATGLPAHKRPVNTVFQQYALFPHRTVFGNVAFGLEIKKRDEHEIESRVASALELVQMKDLGGRSVHEISGGQKQRVALARALVLEPDVLLLDEPMAALDLKLRQQMQLELKNLQERLRITFVFVTHDQDEALVMSDRIVVMNAGRIEQVDGPEELYEKPRTRFAAEFLGVANLLQATVQGRQDGVVVLRTKGGLDLLARDDGGYRDGTAVWVGLRPEKISLVDREANAFKGIIDDEVFLGDWTDWRVRVGDEVLSVGEGNVLARGRRRGDAVQVSFSPDEVLRLDDTEARR